MPRNTSPTPGSYPSDDEPYNHRGQPRRLPKNRADQDHVPRSPQRKNRRRAYPVRLADSATDLSRENDSEDSEVLRGRSSEPSIRDGRRPMSTSVGSSRRNHQRTYPEEIYRGPVMNSGRARNIIGLRRELPWGDKFACLRPKAQQVIDLYLNRGRRGRGDFDLPQDLDVLLCVYFLCRERSDGTGIHIRRCQELPPSCLERLRDGFETVKFADLVGALATYCELQNKFSDNNLEDFMARLVFDQAVVTTLKDCEDYKNLLQCGTVHPPEMASLLSRTVELYDTSPEDRKPKERKGWKQKAMESYQSLKHSRFFH
ncbi:hypothetical protein MMC07_000558 [Pseudocyphellaria aurata]|nr:hypothetical protein [Pseudocyphellaria aurata]